MAGYAQYRLKAEKNVEKKPVALRKKDPLGSDPVRAAFPQNRQTVSLLSWQIGKYDLVKPRFPRNRRI